MTPHLPEAYAPPTVARYGSIQSITAASTEGGCFDDNFQEDQPVPPNFRGECS